MQARGEGGEADPIATMISSHRRLAERLGELTLAADALMTGDSGSAYEAIAGVLGFFERSVARHEADEESSLFPRLSAMPELAETMEALRLQHREHTAVQNELRDAFEDDGRAGEIAGIAARLRAAYDAHIALEEETLFPAAQRALSADDRAAIAAEMEGRRGGGGGRGRGRDGGGGGGGGRGGGGGLR